MNVTKTSATIVAVFVVSVFLRPLGAKAQSEDGAVSRPNRDGELFEDAFQLSSGQNWKTVVISLVRTVSSDLTIPPTVSLKFENGGVCDVKAGATLTINGPLEAPMVRVFRGGGSVV